MSQKAAKTIIYAALLLSACGCLGIAVLLGGIAVYNFLDYDLKLSDTEIGIDLGDVPEVPLLDQWLKPSTGAEAEAPEEPAKAANPPSSQGSIPQPKGTAESGDQVQAGKDCAKLAAALPQYKLLSASVNSGYLTCGFGQEGSYSYAAVIGIKEFATAGDASQRWASQWGPQSEYVKNVQEGMQSLDRFTFSHEGDRFFTTYRNNEEDGVTTYDVTAGRLYNNAMIEFTAPKAPDATASSWEMVEGLAMELVDEHNSE